MARLRPLICLALTHTLVDTCALLIAPLWPGLDQQFGFKAAGLLSTAFIVQLLPTSVSQAVFGYLRDRRAMPCWIWLGPVLAAIFLPLMGLTSSMALFFVLLVIGGFGVGAFHPEAAVTAGRLMPENRTRALSLFMFGGAIGLGIGPTLSGAVVRRWGLEGLGYVVLPTLVLIFVLRRIGRLDEVAQKPSGSQRTQSLREMMEGRIPLAVFLFFVCSLRLVPNMGADKVLAFALNSMDYNEFESGMHITLFLFSASVGMFAMTLCFRSGWEKRFMVICPLMGIPLMLVLGMPGCPHWLFLVTLSLTGLCLWGTTPAMVSYAQQQFPKGAGLASAITMGLSWGLGGLIQAPITTHFSETSAPQQAFHGFIPCLALAACGAWFLPSVTSENSGRIK